MGAPTCLGRVRACRCLAHLFSVSATSGEIRQVFRVVENLKLSTKECAGVSHVELETGHAKTEMGCVGSAGVLSPYLYSERWPFSVRTI